MRSALRAGYGWRDLRQDVMAGLAVGTVAVPLSMALAIATGVPPQHGLYTAIVAGALIALAGGSRFNVSGPTAAFVVILFPIVQQYGLGGLLLATMMAGVILMLLGFARMGQLIQYVPYPVILGFTAGIGVVIAVLQIPDFLGLEMAGLSEHLIDNLGHIGRALDTLDPVELGIGVFTLAVLIIWPRLGIGIPAPLIALAAAAAVAAGIAYWPGNLGIEVETIASRFTWEAGGQSGVGIPPIPPTLHMPWSLPGANGEPLVLTFKLFRDLLGPALAIAVLCAIESLLCAVIADGLTRTRHDPNAELIGQGLGNLVAPLFGGITATSAIARTVTSVRSGARSPIAAVVHSLVVLLAVVALAGVLGLVPMAALAALLFIVAWNMSEPRHVIKTLRSAPLGDASILLICFGLTVIFDMVIAVAVGMGLASALFIRNMARLTQARRIDRRQQLAGDLLPPDAAIYDVNGPLFFGAAEKALNALRLVDPEIRTIILDMRDVPNVDGTGIVGLQSLVEQMHQQGISLIFSGLHTSIIVQFRRAGIRKRAGSLSYCQDLDRASALAMQWHKRRTPTPAEEADKQA